MAGNTATTSVAFGSNVLWNEESVFESDSSTAAIEVQKKSDGTLSFSFK